MSLTRRGAELTEEHRQFQIRLSERVSNAVGKLFRKLVDWERIDESVGVFAGEAALEIMRGRELSRAASVKYLREFHLVEAPDAPPPVNEPDETAFEDLVGELIRSTRGFLKTLSRKGDSGQEAMEKGQQMVRSKSSRMVADGGRKVVENEVRRGNGPVGYARVTDNDPCPFCAMLASRGVYYAGQEAAGSLLYRSDSFAESNNRFAGDGRFKVHDGCCCGLEPVYVRGGKIDLPGDGNQLAREWAEVASGQPDPWKAWQRWRTSKTLPEDYEGDLEGVKRPSPDSRRRFQPARDFRARRESDGRSELERNPVEFVSRLQEQVDRVEVEIGELRARGQSDDDLPIVFLKRRRDSLLSQIDRYQRLADKL